MKKILRHLFLSVAAVMAFSACQEAERNTEELIDPWLRERTPVNVRLESQIGPAVISSDWKTDEVGTVTVSLVTAALDMSAVKVVALDFAYPESEFCPTADLKPGDTVDLTDGTAEFTVTAKSGETRTYTISYTVFTDPLEGTYSFTPVGPLMSDAIGKHNYNCGCIMIGGFEGSITLCQVNDKHWLWGKKSNAYDGIHWPSNEDDNILSFSMDRADDVTGQTFGTIVNTPGEDGKYADYVLADADGKDAYGKALEAAWYDINEEYRLIPAGKSRWAKLGDGYVTIYAFDDVNYTKPLHKLELLDKNHKSYYKEYKYKQNGKEEKIENAYIITWEGSVDAAGEPAFKSLEIPSLALHRSFGEGPFVVGMDASGSEKWGEERWYVNNIRNVFWLIQKDSDSPLADHEEYLAQ